MRVGPTIPTPVGEPCAFQRTSSLVCRLSPRPWENLGSDLGHLALPTDYPHARGRTLPISASSSKGFRLSPRPWESPWCVGLRGRPAPTIPTPVGEPERHTSGSTSRPDYPHARGRTASSFSCHSPPSRLSPRPWENRVGGWSFLGHRPTIPTLVGEPSHCRPSWGLAPDYPRARGRTSRHSTASRAGARLSPRLWENRVVGPAVGSRVPTIPTPVGEPPAARGSAGWTAGYPHARGRTRSGSRVRAGGRRLSPRPWESPLGRWLQVEDGPTIPTPVGDPTAGSITRRRRSRLSPRPWENLFLNTSHNTDG